MSANFYTVPVIIDRDGLMSPDLPAGTEYCCSYGVVNHETVAMVRTPALLGQRTGRTRRTNEQEVTDAMREMGSNLPERDPIDRWRIGGA